MHQFKRALELKPGDPQTQTDLARLHARLGEFDLAESQLAERHSGTPPVIQMPTMHLATFTEKHPGRMQQQTASSRQSRLRPDYIDALCNLGAVLIEQLKFEDADSCYSTALRYQPEQPVYTPWIWQSISVNR